MATPETTAEFAGDPADVVPRTKAEVLAEWLRRMVGREIVSTTVFERPASGPSERTREVDHQVRVEVLGNVVNGGQAAVAKVRVLEPAALAGTTAALRLEWDDPDPGAGDRRNFVLEMAWLSRNPSEEHQALIHVHDSFVVDVNTASLPLPPNQPWRVPASMTRLWADLMDWGTPLSEFQEEQGAPEPLLAVTMLVPVMVTIGELCTSRSLVHRDLDEENLLVMGDGTVKIADWGAATSFRPELKLTYTRVVGKTGRFPPEVEHGEGPTGPFTDAWLLGRVLLYLITGADSAYLQGDPDHRWHPRVSELPQRVADVVRTLCAPDRTARPELGAAAAALASWVGEEVAAEQARSRAVTQAADDAAADRPRTAPPAATDQPAPVARWVEPVVWTGCVLVVAAVVALIWWAFASGVSLTTADGVTDSQDETVADPKDPTETPSPPPDDDVTAWVARVDGDVDVTSVGIAEGHASTFWQDDMAIIRVTIDSITNTGNTDQTFSWACDREAFVATDGTEDIQAGPFVTVTITGEGDLQPYARQPSSWHVDDPQAAALQPAACATISDTDVDTPLGTTWTSVTVPAGQTVTVPPEQNTLDFVAAMGTPAEQLTVDYFPPSYGMLFLSDTRTAAIDVRFDTDPNTEGDA